MDKLPNLEPCMKGLEFREDGHAYALNGRPLPSVTQIMAPLAHRVYGAVDPAVLNRAAERGTAVHEAYEMFLDCGMAEIPPDYLGFLTAFKTWVSDTGLKPLCVESRVYHKLLNYAGTVDLLCSIDGRLVLVDYKTSATALPKLYRVQLEAYSQALGSHGVSVEEKRVFHPKADGTYREYRFPARDAEAWRIFNSCLNIADYMADK